MDEKNAKDAVKLDFSNFESLVQSDFVSLYYITSPDQNEIEGVGIFLLGEEVMEYHLSATSVDGRKNSVLKNIIHAAVSSAFDLGLSGVYLGGGTTESINDTLLLSKSRFSKNLLTFSAFKRDI